VPGVFITFEGPEGAGKSLLARRLVELLEASGVRARLTREPGGTRLGEDVRSLVLAETQGDGAIDPMAEALLFNAARAQLVAEVIRPALEAGETVICDRFADSTLAYQGFGAGAPINDLRAIAEAATGGLYPDRTVLLDLDPEVGLARKSDGARNRFELTFDVDFHRRVRAGFFELVRMEPDRWRVVDANLPVDAVFEDVRAAVADLVA
jgi:dTMP kinase